MKLVRYGEIGLEKPGILDARFDIRDLSHIIDDITPDKISPASLTNIAKLDLNTLPIVPAGVRLGQPVAPIRKCICTGPNYHKMSAESGAPIPEVPRLYMKADTSLVGPQDCIILPPWGTTVHWEIEIGVIMGSDAWQIPEKSILEFIAGYCVVNDIVDHEAQTVGFGESVKGRSAPGFGPVGPWLVTTDEIVDPQNLNLWLDVDGHRFTDGSSSDMVFKIPYLVSYVSQYMKLRAGDLIVTGTPGGVGRKTSPPFVLAPGMIMRSGISGLGEQFTKIVET